MLNPILWFQRPASAKAVNSCKLAGQPYRRDLPRRGLRCVAALVGIAAISACSTPTTSNLVPGQQHNCLLPGQVTRIAGQPFLSARRAVTTNPASCKEQGGEVLSTSAQQAESPQQVRNDQQASADPQ